MNFKSNLCLCLCLLMQAAALNATGQDADREPVKLTLPRFSYPTWFPAGDRILYESNVTGNWEIFVMDDEGLQDGGGHIRQLTDIGHMDRMPALSPSGEHVAFISDRDGDLEVFRMNVDGSGIVQLTHNEVAEIHPYWAPDGSSIIYNSRVAGERLYTIRMMNRDGSGDRELLNDGELNSYAQMSPDGKWLVFDKWQDNDEENGEIYLLELETGELSRLTENEAAYDGYPTWFPSGDRVMFASEVGGDFKLFSVQTDGSGLRQETFGRGNDARPDVSSDGRKVVFNRELDGNINIHVQELGR